MYLVDSGPARRRAVGGPAHAHERAGRVCGGRRMQLRGSGLELVSLGAPPRVLAPDRKCSASASPSASGSHWFQMRLWTQARAMGEHAAHCMLADLRAVDASQQQPQQEAVGEPAGQPGRTDEARALSWPPPAELVPDTLTGFAFELFAHTTTFFGFKVRHTRTQLYPLTLTCMRVHIGLLLYAVDTERKISKYRRI